MPERRAAEMCGCWLYCRSQRRQMTSGCTLSLRRKQHTDVVVRVCLCSPLLNFSACSSLLLVHRIHQRNCISILCCTMSCLASCCAVSSCNSRGTAVHRCCLRGLLDHRWHAVRL